MANQETNVKYVLTSPNGYRAAFNDSTDADYVGGLLGDDAVTGLDSPEVRPYLYEKVQTDGAVALPFLHGTRPITLQGTMFDATLAGRNARLEKLDLALNDCMVSDGTLVWTPTGGAQRYVRVRKNQPTRIKGGFAKDYMVALVASDPRVYSSVESEQVVPPATTIANQANNGSALAPPIIRLYGPGTSPLLSATFAGVSRSLGFLGLTLAASQYLEVDPLNGTALIKDRLIANGEWEVNSTGWVTSTPSAPLLNAGATIGRTTVAANVLYGVGAELITITGATGASWGAAYPIAVQAGRTYTFSVWVRGAGGGQFQLAAAGNAGITSPATITGPIFTATATYTKYTLSFTPIGSGTAYVGVRQNESGNPNRTIAIDEAFVEDPADTGSSAYQYVNFPVAADWWGLLPGLNDLSLSWASGSTADSMMRVNWRDTWL